ncbi:MAG: hypothetical protein A3K10_04455 [Bacteroidetes bacterium RIFCSPLOWO2_12_FULL_31_6]|nr:MAG: hypothetical protein A3K10_04455 [Bacteroidetes bacterium RIFCSPLOWO2_12_FULL_31_6]
MRDSYQTIQFVTEGIYKEKGSKFIAFAFPVSSEKEIKVNIEKIKKEHHSAKHLCFAYVLRADKNIFRSFDAGEPSNTAGKPILGQIQSNNLTNIIIIVVRYFGGTLLGTSGLIQAYKTAAADAILKATIITKFKEEQLEIIFNYDKIGEVMKIIKEHKIEISQQTITEKYNYLVNAKASEVDIIFKKLNLIAIVNRMAKL